MTNCFVPIKKCWSGILCPPKQKAFRRVFLVTPRVLALIESDPETRDALLLPPPNNLLTSTIIDELGVTPHIFTGRAGKQTVGLHMSDLAEEQDLFSQAIKTLVRLSSKTEQAVFLKMMGINAHEKVFDLDQEVFLRVLATLGEIDPSLEIFSYLNVVEHGPHLLWGTKPWQITVSLDLLSKDPGTITEDSFHERIIRLEI